MKKYLNLLSSTTKLKCIGVVLMAFVSSYLASVCPVKLGELCTAITDGKISTLSQGITAIVTFGLIGISAECISTLRRIMLDCVISKHEAETRERVIGKMLKMPGSYFKCDSGERTAQLNQGIGGLSQLIKISCNDVIATLLTTVCTLVQMVLNASGVMVLIMLAYLVVSFTISTFQIKSQNGMREQIHKSKNSFDGQTCQSIKNIEMIRSMSAEDYETKRLLPQIKKISETEMNHQKTMGTFDCMKQVLKMVFQLIVIYMSLVMISKGEMERGAVVTVLLLFQQLVKPIEDVYRFVDDIASATVKARALTEITLSGTDPMFNIKSSDKNINVSEIVAEDVTITNPEGDTVVAIYDRVKIPCNKKVALKGENGCGKSSLLRAFNRYYPIKEGVMKIFGYNQNEYSQKELTSLIYYSPQTSLFITGTVRDNLKYGIDDDVSDEKLADALRSVKLIGGYNGVIADKAEDALNSMLSEGAGELSGGMKQRLALARAFLRKPKLFMFDEITSNLDAVATRCVLDNLEAYAKEIGAGIIYISHEASVVDRCDEVIELKNNASINVA